MKKLLGEARASKVAVIYSTIPNTTTADIIPDVAPAADEPSVTSGVDKFFKTNLEQILKDKGIQTVIVVGTSAEGLVTYTGGGAALRGFNVVVPVDGMASVEAFAGAICGLAHDPSTNHLAQADADENRHDKVLVAACGTYERCRSDLIMSDVRMFGEDRK
jgi:nicotinamidase-related amidase